MPGVVFVTGAAGALGSHLMHALGDAGWRTRALVHRRPVARADEHVPGSIMDPTALDRGAAGVDAVLHLAARTHARRESHYRVVNLEGTARALAAATRAGVPRFVHVSTRAISPNGGAYSRSKLAAEELVRQAPGEHVIVRLPEVYGAGADEGVDQMLERARRGAPIPIVGAGADVLCPVHVADAVHALVVSLTSGAAANRTYTLAGECHTARDVALTCAAAAARGSRLVHVPVIAVRLAAVAARVLPLPLYPDQPARLHAQKPPASPEAREDLDFKPRPLRDGVNDALRRAR